MWFWPQGQGGNCSPRGDPQNRPKFSSPQSWASMILVLPVAEKIRALRFLGDGTPVPDIGVSGEVRVLARISRSQNSMFRESTELRQEGCRSRNHP